ncbi:glycoside hydrolase family 76 protein [Phytoactinopolyspora halotolerans]|uniref:Glycosyl hydrolase n=1 Tax=Phytoactinopolyspora halotolerans TaxID=1981512 RepID=A0A6L9SGH1_9ACTN|nr:glycoside hydrolase family 76 protein [Phytoactinopolyspora halotolerans]NEE04207.1 glycosyl hydrolase [Phytoactinopolyspora halotolerans]
MNHSRLSRRTFGTALGGIGIAALVPFTNQRAGAATGNGLWRRRALASYDALQRYLYLPDSGLYRENYPVHSEENPYSYVWPLREATAATLDVDRLPATGTRFAEDVVRRFQALEHYWDAQKGAYDSYLPPPLGTGGDAFYDDNAVIGLEFIRRYRMSGQQDMLSLAARVFDFLPQAWDTDPTRECPGGMHWVHADWNPYQGGTNVTSLASELAAHLYEETGESRYLDWARRTYTWVRDCMRRGDGLYANGIRLDGTIEETLWTYNSGSMVGAATLLYRATGDESYLRMAVQDADGAIEYWAESDRLYSQPAIFNAILFANLLLLESVLADRARGIRDIMTRYAEQIWKLNRDDETGLFHFQASGGGPPDPDLRPHTLHQSGAIQTFALLAWRRDDYDDAA